MNQLRYLIYTELVFLDIRVRGTFQYLYMMTVLGFGGIEVPFTPKYVLNNITLPFYFFLYLEEYKLNKNK